MDECQQVDEDEVCHRWFFKEDTTSLISSHTCSGLHGGDSGNLLSL